MAAVRHLGFVMRVWWPPTTHEGHLVVFIIDAVVVIICTFSILRVWLQNAYSRPRGVAILTPNELVLTFGVYTSVSNLVKIDEEMRPWECPQTDTHTRTDAKRFYYLSHAICYSYGADNENDAKAVIWQQVEHYWALHNCAARNCKINFAKWKALKILPELDVQMQIQAKIGDTVHDHSGKPGTHYMDLELNNEFWNRLQITTCCTMSPKSLPTMGLNRCQTILHAVVTI